MIIALTGISSGLARFLVPKLQKDPTVERIIGIDVNDYRANLDKITFIKGDIRDAAGMEFALKDVDVLFHLAFIVGEGRLPNKKIIYDINVNGSKTVFSAAAKNKIKKIIYLSSLSAYGHQPETPPVVTEDSPLLGPVTTNFYYSHTKGIVEEFLDQFEENHPEIALIRVRPPIFSRTNASIDPRAVSTAKRTNSRALFPLNHNGKLPVQLIDEDDLTDVLVLMMKRDIRGAYNVASPPLPDLYTFLKDEFNHELKPASYALNNLFLGMQNIWAKMGWIQAFKYMSLLDTHKVERELNWKPKMNTEQIIRAAIGSPKETAAT